MPNNSTPRRDGICLINTMVFTVYYWRWGVVNIRAIDRPSIANQFNGAGGGVVNIRAIDRPSIAEQFNGRRGRCHVLCLRVYAIAICYGENGSQLIMPANTVPILHVRKSGHPLIPPILSSHPDFSWDIFSPGDHFQPIFDYWLFFSDA